MRTLVSFVHVDVQKRHRCCDLIPEIRCCNGFLKFAIVRPKSGATISLKQGFIGFRVQGLGCRVLKHSFYSAVRVRVVRIKQVVEEQSLKP